MTSQSTKNRQLLQHIATERFDLVALGRWEAARQYFIVEQDPEVLGLFALRKQPRSFLKVLMNVKGTKFPKRVHHKIIARSTGKPIGLHTIQNLKHNSATMAVVIYDKAWWGKDAAIEVRKAIIIAYKEANGVTQFCSDVHSRNFASILNYKKLGFENTGVRYSSAYDELRNEPADYFSFSLRGEQLAEKLKVWGNFNV
jgi:RimJ/RimL family protein N-acetyltransferase